MKATYYEILGVDRSATSESIKSAFREKARKHHPDVNNSSIESAILFRIVYSAYSVLKDEKSRRTYDTYLDRSAVFARDADPGGNRRGRTGKPVLSDASDTLALVYAHLNYLLWEIEDLLSDPSAETFVMDILTRIDTQVLTTAGFPDYFYAARNMTAPERANGSRGRFQNDGEHRPFVNITDYFYNVRNRANKFIRRTTPSEPVPVQAIFEIYNDAVQKIGTK